MGMPAVLLTPTIWVLALALYLQDADLRCTIGAIISPWIVKVQTAYNL